MLKKENISLFFLPIPARMAVSIRKRTTFVIVNVRCALYAKPFLHFLKLKISLDVVVRCRGFGIGIRMIVCCFFQFVVHTAMILKTTHSISTLLRQLKNSHCIPNMFRHLCKVLRKKSKPITFDLDLYIISIPCPIHFTNKINTSTWYLITCIFLITFFF
jgi:hypothetical protein